MACYGCYNSSVAAAKRRTRRASGDSARRDVTDLISRILQVLRQDLSMVVVSARDAGLMEPVEPWDEG